MGLGEKYERVPNTGDPENAVLAPGASTPDVPVGGTAAAAAAEDETGSLLDSQQRTMALPVVNPLALPLSEVEGISWFSLFVHVACTAFYVAAAVFAFLDIYDATCKFAVTLLLVWMSLGRIVGVFVFTNRRGDGAQDPGQLAVRGVMRSMLLNWHVLFGTATTLYVFGTSLLTSIFASSSTGD
mgnify:CR=1 FL=1